MDVDLKLDKVGPESHLYLPFYFRPVIHCWKDLVPISKLNCFSFFQLFLFDQKVSSSHSHLANASAVVVSLAGTITFPPIPSQYHPNDTQYDSETIPSQLSHWQVSTISQFLIYTTCNVTQTTMLQLTFPI